MAEGLGRSPLAMRDAVHLAVSSVAIVALTWVGVAFTPEWSTTSLWWPAAGATVAAVVTARPVMRPWMVLLVVVLTGAGNYLAGGSLAISAAYGLGNAAEAAVVGWWFTRGSTAVPQLSTLRDLWRLVVAAILGSVVGVAAGLVILSLGGLGDSPILTTTHLLTSDVSAIVLIVALVLRQVAPPGPARWPEAAAQLVVVVALIVVTFGPGSELPVAFIVVVPLTWGVLRLRLRWATVQIVLALVTVLYLTALGFGPFADVQSRNNLEYAAFTLSQLFVLAMFLLLEALALTAADQRRMLARLSDSERLLRAGFNDSLLGTAIARPHSGTVHLAEANRAARDLLGLPTGTSPESVDWLTCVTEGRADMESALLEVLDGRREEWHAEIQVLAGDGEHRWLEAAAAPMAEEDLLVLHLIDITARKRAETTAKHLALFDTVTGLPNRSLLHDRLEQALATAERSGDDVTVLVMDLDDFKRVNDTIGSAGGDRVLAAIAHRLSESVRDIDTVARLGGDEFAVILPGVSDAVARERVVELLEVVREPVDVDGLRHQVTASMGIVTSRPGVTSLDLLRDADIAMYVAKGRGRDRATHFEETQRDRAVAAARVAAELDGALERGEIVLHVQPIVHLATGRITACEALVRWQHPTRGLMPPSTWLHHASQGPHGRRLETWVLNEACRLAAQWHDRWGAEAPRVHVNVSTSLLEDGDLATRVIAALEQCGAPPQSLVVELTEHDLEAVRSSLTAELDRLRAQGVRLAVDDFGTGYSAFSRLSELPLDELKIDYLFTSRMLHDERSRAVVTAILRLATKLGLETVAEGVESTEQASALAAVGCGHGQGFLWSPAVPSDSIVTLVESGAFSTPLASPSNHRPAVVQD